MNPETEAQIVADNPQLFAERGDNNVVAYWNFLPPEELNELLTLYKRVTQKTLRISKTFGIEGKKLLTPEDDFDALKDFTHILEGNKLPLEKLSLEWQTMQTDDESSLLNSMRCRAAFSSGKAHPQSGSRAVFFCYVLPLKNEDGEWTHESGQVLWLLHDLATGKTLDSPAQIADFIRSDGSTPRRTSGENETLGRNSQKC